jgi:hypothetical protein
VPVTVTVYVPERVLFFALPQPTIPTVTAIAISAIKLAANNFRTLRFFHPASGRIRNDAMTPAIATGRWIGSAGR